MKVLTDAQYSFKAAVRRAVKMAGGTTAAAEVVRAHGSQLSHYGNVDQPAFAPIDVAFELDHAAGDDVILRAWADLRGFDLTARTVDEQVSHDLTVAAGQVARETGELISATIDAAADGKVTPNEAKQLDELAADAQEKIVNIRESVRRSMVARS